MASVKAYKQSNFHCYISANRKASCILSKGCDFRYTEATNGNLSTEEAIVILYGMNTYSDSKPEADVYLEPHTASIEDVSALLQNFLGLLNLFFAIFTQK